MKQIDMLQCRRTFEVRRQHRLVFSKEKNA
jgi:hypothetical protein